MIQIPSVGKGSLSRARGPDNSPICILFYVSAAEGEIFLHQWKTFLVFMSDSSPPPSPH